jgi:hypothetical protein
MRHASSGKLRTTPECCSLTSQSTEAKFCSDRMIGTSMQTSPMAPVRMASSLGREVIMPVASPFPTSDTTRP